MIFSNLTVDENLAMGAYLQSDAELIARNRDYVFSIFPRLKERIRQMAGTLSGGEQQMLAIGRALMSNPRLLLLDEVSLGLAPVVIEQIYAALPAITGQGTTVLVVEQDVNQSMRVADRVQCLLEGRTVLEGAPADLTRDQIASAYFGI